MKKRQTRITRLVASVAMFALLGSCGRDAASDADAGSAGSIVLYSSQDDYVLREAVNAFEAETGIDVRVVGDTEATKTTGLMNRLLSEHELGTAAADVWWSNEPFGSVRLSEAGVLEPYTSAAAENAFDTGWPGTLRGEKSDWYGHALRARVIVYSTDRVTKPPTTIEALASPERKGRVGLARPGFGTTRGHMAALLQAWGAEKFEAWLVALKANGVRVYDSNSSVVRAVWMGEIDLGLTDTDDVLVGRGRGWSVGMHPPTDAPLVVPSTIGLVAGAKNPDNAKRFIDWVLSGPGELVLARSESRNTPVNPTALADLGDDAHHAGFVDIGSVEPDLGSGYDESIAEQADEALKICDRVLGSS